MTCKGYIKGPYLQLPMQLIPYMQNNFLYDYKSYVAIQHFVKSKLSTS